MFMHSYCAMEAYIIYVPERSFMHLTVSCWFLISQVSKHPKRQVYKTSGLQNVRFTKCQVFKMLGCKTSSFKMSLLVKISKCPFSKKYIDLPRFCLKAVVETEAKWLKPDVLKPDVLWVYPPPPPPPSAEGALSRRGRMKGGRVRGVDAEMWTLWLTKQHRWLAVTAPPPHPPPPPPTKPVTRGHGSPSCPWALKPPLLTLHILGLSLTSICVCTHRYDFIHSHMHYAGMHT